MATFPNPGAGRSHHPIRVLFVANRGEIAARIARTCRRLGIDAILPVTEGPAAVDLLDSAALVRAAAAAGADAVHPGFGFLAESPDLAAAVEAAGLRWIGPPPGAIRQMGDKSNARRLAASLGVPIIPGYDARDQSDEALTAAATSLGVPLVVKPAAGGGGKGIRIVRDLAHLPDALASSRREAEASFGVNRLVLEQLLDGPRHVEVQVLFDDHGAGVHLGERDCSLQRRHQKILEESPSSAVPPELRAEMGAAALRLASAVGYVSAGTCEFLLDDRGRFFFLEMNTRLQVEHPVTELVTGRDLVADQLAIAAGEPVELTQDEADDALARGGNAIEVRLYAEDAEAGFLPATGRVEVIRWPAGLGIRVDAGIEAGAEVGARFDPMLAKIVAHGANRGEALDRLANALDETVVLGLVTNLRFLRWLVRQPVVRDGQARIDTLDRIWPPDDWPERVAIPDSAWTLAAEALLGEAGDGNHAGWRLNVPRRLRIACPDTGEERTVELPDGPDRDPIREAGPKDGQKRSPDAPTFVRRGDVVYLDLAGRSVAFQVAPPPDVDRAARGASAHAHGGGPSELQAPMPGSVLAVHRSAGDHVRAGEPIVTLEAMKMEHAVSAAVDGTLAEVVVRAGDQVARGQLLAVVEP